MQSYSQFSYVSIYFHGVVKFSITETAWSNVVVDARPVPGPVANQRERNVNFFCLKYSRVSLWMRKTKRDEFFGGFFCWIFRFFRRKIHKDWPGHKKLRRCSDVVRLPRQLACHLHRRADPYSTMATGCKTLIRPPIYIFRKKISWLKIVDFYPHKACVQLYVLRGISTPKRYSKPTDDSPSTWRKGRSTSH